MHKTGLAMRTHLIPAATIYRMLDTHPLTAVFGIKHMAALVRPVTDISRAHIDEPDITPVQGTVAVIIVIAAVAVITAPVFAVAIIPALALPVVVVLPVVIVARPETVARYL
jgi:hypothetical protein